MLAQLTAFLSMPKTLSATHLLVLLPKGKTLPRDLPQRDLLTAVLKRQSFSFRQQHQQVCCAQGFGQR